MLGIPYRIAKPFTKQLRNHRTRVKPMSDIKEKLSKLNKWISKHRHSKDILPELVDLKERAESEDVDTKNAALEELNDRFYKDLEFGTSGLRGVMGAGSNRMNIYTVRKATHGVAKYVNDYYKNSHKNPSAAIAYDSRLNSELFAKTTEEIFLSHGIDVFLFDKLMPVPALSFAIRHHKCAVGIMITASHNSYEYNGYKVYDEHGCQITDNVATEILKNMEQIDIFDETLHTHTGVANPTHIGDETKDAFCEAVLKERVTWASEEEMQDDMENLSIVYTPLNGAGNIPVRQVLSKIGLKNIHIVKEQELPDGNFPTCMYPNPEKKEALGKGLQLLREVDADILIATDPDGDRIGVAVKTGGKEAGSEKTANQEYVLNGHEIGLLLFDFICDMKSKTGQMPQNPIAARTLVSSKMFDSIATQYGASVKVTPTGFKYIGELITELEKQGKINDYIFGFEESHGYLSGTYVRDKDGTNSAMLVCQMAAYYKKQGKTLLDRLEELHEKHGYFLNYLLEFVFEGAKGENKMAEIMIAFRDKINNPIKEIAGKKVTKVIDFKGSLEFPNLNMLEFILEDGGGLVIRPSGTEPKLKIYLTAKGHSKKNAEEGLKAMEEFTHNFLKNSLQN